MPMADTVFTFPLKTLLIPGAIMVVEIFFFFNLMREIKGEVCCKARKPGRKIMDFKVTKTVTTLPFINCVKTCFSLKLV